MTRAWIPRTESKRPVMANAHDVASVLPNAAVQSLIEAALVDAETPVGESFVRSKALSFTVTKLKRKYPQFFQPGA